MATTGRTSTRRARARASILEATRQVVLRDGIPAFTVEAVAELAGVSKPSVYYYFESKEVLIRELVHVLAAAEQRAVGEAVQAAADGPAILEDFVRAYVDHHRSSLDLFKVQYLWSQVLGLSAGDGDAEINRGMVALFDTLEHRLSRERDAGRLRSDVKPRRLGVALWMAAQGVVQTLALLDSAGTTLTHDPTRLVDELVHALTVGAFSDLPAQPEASTSGRWPR